jgi:hypothetical protein
MGLPDFDCASGGNGDPKTNTARANSSFRTAESSRDARPPVKLEGFGAVHRIFTFLQLRFIVGRRQAPLDTIRPVGLHATRRLSFRRL